MRGAGSASSTFVAPMNIGAFPKVSRLAKSPGKVGVKPRKKRGDLKGFHPLDPKKDKRKKTKRASFF